MKKKHVKANEFQLALLSQIKIPNILIKKFFLQKESINEEEFHSNDHYFSLLERLKKEINSCSKCILSQTRCHTVFGSKQKQKPQWMIIGEAPGEQEDLIGEPFVGQSGKLLDEMLKSVNIKREQEVFITNIIKCRPPKNRNPTIEEINSCLPFLINQIKIIKPKILFVLGRFAAKAFIKQELNISKLRQSVYLLDLEGEKIPAIFSFHPAYLLRNPSEKYKAWQDLQFLVSEYKKI